MDFCDWIQVTEVFSSDKRRGGGRGGKNDNSAFTLFLVRINSGTYPTRSSFQPYIAQILSALKYELAAEEMLYALKNVID